ncbi:MAG: hypothetical protein SFZ24_09055 [Planctomycetota bacterium]|nr:hypothetical protein [Planctomycetota bacterium]
MTSSARGDRDSTQKGPKAPLEVETTSIFVREVQLPADPDAPEKSGARDEERRRTPRVATRPLGVVGEPMS